MSFGLPDHIRNSCQIGLHDCAAYVSRRRARALIVFKVRNRLINFRVTEDEFRQIKAAAAVQGCRCTSDFARMVMLGTAHGGGTQGAEELDTQMTSLTRRLANLESDVARLTGKLGAEGLAANGD